ncbi:MAG: cobyric acid synthase [Clostridium sp.]
MAKAIMIQGTMSNAGKSLLTAGLCRIFKEDGYRTAPFKSQNMALNSFITEDGLEMGRAQVVQAQAAGITPSVSMNPILLKPSSDTGSQVVVNGIPIGNMDARAYFAYKKELIPTILQAYEELNREYDIIVIEGAGSPAEINLKKDDIVNMGMARMAGAPVLLVGDIDRGGVFAQLYGTVMLLETEERSLVKGMIINKFRGDKTILDPGTEMIEKLCGIPVVGVTPYMNVDIEDEDSLSSRLNVTHENQALVDLAVIHFPRLSNFTDFNVFSCLNGVSVRYVESVEQLGTPDLIILPGTKNTIEDLLWMRQNGLEAAVLKQMANEVPIFGICGGYQMMGGILKDEMGTEAGIPGRSISGMGIFPCITEFEEEKTRTRVEGRFAPTQGIFRELSGMPVQGYEIHMGKTYCSEFDGTKETAPVPLVELMEYQGDVSALHMEKQDGMAVNHCYGTYVHGIFDSEAIAETMVKALLIRKGGNPEQLKENHFDYEHYRENQFEHLASELRKSLDMKKIYEILEMGIGKEAEVQKGENYDKIGTGTSV